MPQLGGAGLNILEYLGSVPFEKLGKHDNYDKKHSSCPDGTQRSTRPGQRRIA